MAIRDVARVTTLHRTKWTWMLACMIAAVAVACGGETVDGTPQDAGPDGASVDTDEAGDDAPDSAGPDDIEPGPVDTGRLDIPFLDTGTDPGAETDTDFEPIDTNPSIPDLVFDDPPVIEVVAPGEGSTLGGDLVVIEGGRFTWDIEVRIGGMLQPRVDVIDEYTLAFFTEPMSAGLYDVKLATPGGSAAMEGAFRAVSPVRVLAVEPPDGRLPGGETITISGSGFTEGTRFFVGEREAVVTGTVEDGRVEALLPAGTRPGPVDVVAVGDRPATLVDGFRYRPSPFLAGVVPSVGHISGGRSLRLDGAGITEACTAYVGGRPTPVTVGADGWPVAVQPPGAAGLVDVSLDCGPDGEAYLAGAFLYEATVGDGPVRVWPARGLTTGGEVVTVSGYALGTTERVTFGDVEARILAVFDDRVDVLSPEGTPGTVDVFVERADDVAAVPSGWRWVELPTFAALTPSRAPAFVPVDAVISGTGLDVIDGYEVDARVVSSGSVTPARAEVTIPPGAPGRSDVTARIGSLRVATGLALMRGEDLRVDRSVPATAPIAGGTPLYVIGDGFDSSCVVRVGGQALPTERVAGGLLRVTLPPSDPGFQSVDVTGCIEWTSPTGVTFINPARVPGGVRGGPIDGSLAVSVVESGSNRPIEGASVMVNVRRSSPYVGLTDARGQITFAGEDLVGPQTVTAFAPGRSAETYVDVNASEVTLVLNALPSPPCDPSDPACQPPPPVPPGSIQGFLTGLRKVTDPPPGARLWAVVETTRMSPGFVNPDPGPLGQLAEDGAFRITSRLGDVALIALCGYRFDAPPNEFVPLSMGVVRGISLRPDRPNARASIDCNIPLDQSVTIKLTGAPELVPVDESPSQNLFPGRYQARFTFEFGGEGVFESIAPLIFNENIHTGGRFPRLGGALAGVRFDVVAGAYPRIGTTPAAEAWLRNVSGYGSELVFPDLLAVPDITIPSAVDSQLVGGYIEWELDPLAREPDYFYVFATSPGEAFPRWTVYLPGDARSFNFAEFPTFVDLYGPIPRPGNPVGALSLFVRATNSVAFDFDDFDRIALRQSTWRAASTAFRYFTLVTPGGSVNLGP